MRVGSNKNHTFEKASTTKLPVVVLAIFIFILIYIGLSMLIYYGFYKDAESPLGAGIVFTFVTIMLLIVVRALFIGSFSEKKYIKLKKGKREKILIKNLGNTQAQNNSNYYSSIHLSKNFIGQLLNALIWETFFFALLCIFFLSFMYSSERFTIIFLSLIIIGSFGGGFINSWREYVIIRNIIKKRNVSIIRKNVGSYYIHHDWIYFY